ncbi:MAG TPA: hypothetical protein VEL07_21905 [Planctomycetota bacterium]|nr:hypothetical protein [Planctomycetota bacterium]
MHQETREATATEAEVDSHLSSLTKRTSIAELTRAGRTTNLKTLSERDLKEWIKEALRRVITSTTSLGVTEREQLLAATRTELTAIMVARRADDHAHAVDALAMAALTVERDALIDRLAIAKAEDSGIVADLRLQLAEASSRHDDFRARIAGFETRLAQVLAATVADPQELADLRGQLGEREAEVAKVAITLDEAQRVARAVMARLVTEQADSLAAATVHADRVAAGDRTNADLDRRRGDAERRATSAEAKATAATVHAATTASLAKTAAQRGDAQRAGSAAKLEEAEATHARLIDELARARADTVAEQVRLAAALRASGEAGAAADQRARLAGETLAAAERQLQISTTALKAADADRLGAKHGLKAVEDARADLAAERDRLAAALKAADAARGGADARLLAVEGERDAARGDVAAATRRAAATHKETLRDAQKAAQKHDAAHAKALPDDVAALQAALIRARAVVTDVDGVAREDVAADLVARKPGRWLTAWRDAKGRLKAARTVGDHWMNAGRMDGVDPAAGLASEPVILARGDTVLAAWRDESGHARLATLDDTGRTEAAPRDLGPSLGAPGLSRGGGTAANFVVTTDAKGHVHLRDADGAAPVDLTAALKAPPAAGGAAAWHWPLEGSRHITYRDATGAVHEYLELKGRWFHAALSARTGSPAAAADPIGYAPGDHEHIVYLGVDGHIHELCFDVIVWRHNDLTASAGAPAASGRPAGGYVAGRHCVVFRGVDGKAHSLRLRRDWRHQPLADLGAIAGDPQLATSGGEGAVSYRGADGQRRWARFGADPVKTAIADLPA